MQVKIMKLAVHCLELSVELESMTTRVKTMLAVTIRT